MYVMGEMLANKDARFVGLGNSSQSLACPVCRGHIDSDKVLRGDYDVKRNGGWGWPVVAAVVTTIFAQPQFHDGEGWSANEALAAAAALGIAVGAAVYLMLRFVRMTRRS